MIGTTNARDKITYQLSIKLSKKLSNTDFVIKIYSFVNGKETLYLDPDEYTDEKNHKIVLQSVPSGNYLIEYYLFETIGQPATLKKQKLISLNKDTEISFISAYLPSFTSNKLVELPYKDDMITQITEEDPEDWIITLKESQTLTFTDLHGTETIDVFVVGGGGAGGPAYGKTVNNSWYSSGGGGGGGGQIAEEYNIPIQAGIPYKIIVGAGGQVTSTRVDSTSAIGPNGEDSSAFGITAKGGNGGHSGMGNSAQNHGGVGGVGQTDLYVPTIGYGGRGCALLNADYATKNDPRYEVPENSGISYNDHGYTPFIGGYWANGSPSVYFGRGGGGGDGFNGNAMVEGVGPNEWSAIEIIDSNKYYPGCERAEFLYGTYFEDYVQSFTGDLFPKHLWGHGATYVSSYSDYMDTKTINAKYYTTAGRGAPNTGSGGGGGASFGNSTTFLPGDGGSGIVIIRNHRTRPQKKN